MYKIRLKTSSVRTGWSLVKTLVSRQNFSTVEQEETREVEKSEEIKI